MISIFCLSIFSGHTYFFFLPLSNPFCLAIKLPFSVFLLCLFSSLSLSLSLSHLLFPFSLFLCLFNSVSWSLFPTSRYTYLSFFLSKLVLIVLSFYDVYISPFINLLNTFFPLTQLLFLLTSSSTPQFY